MWAAIVNRDVPEIERFRSTEEGPHALYYAIIANRPDIIDMLRRRGDPVIAFSGPIHALDVAVLCGHLDLARKFHTEGESHSNRIVKVAILSNSVQMIEFVHDTLGAIFNIDHLIYALMGKNVAEFMLENYAVEIFSNRITEEHLIELNMTALNYASHDAIYKLYNYLPLICTKDIVDSIIHRNDPLVIQMLSPALKSKGLIDYVRCRMDQLKIDCA